MCEPQKKGPKKLNYKERVAAGLQKGGINKVSKKKQNWNKLYQKQKEEDEEWQTCKVCGAASHKSTMEPHHPYGRANENILIYWWIHAPCHEKIHKNPNEARKNKLLFF